MKVLLLLGTVIWIVFAAPPQKITCKKITEASGLLHSKKYPDIFWMHNDSGDKPRLYAVNKNTLECVATVKIKKAKHRDWEDISYINGDIVIGDFGNNKSKRKNLKLYIIDEPNPYQTDTIKVKKTVHFTYSDQHGSDVKNYDCEAIFSFNNRLYLLSKHREDRNTTLYKVDDSIAQKIIDYPIDGKVTGADSNGRYIVVLTYDMLYLLEPTKKSENIFDGKIYKKPIDAGQVEGVALSQQTIYVVNEDSELFTYRIEDLKRR